jgi:hypothetical protein
MYDSPPILLHLLISSAAPVSGHSLEIPRVLRRSDLAARNRGEANCTGCRPLWPFTRLLAVSLELGFPLPMASTAFVAIQPNQLELAALR